MRFATHLSAMLILAPCCAHAQEALRNSLAGDAAAAAQRNQQMAQPYTIKSGDFKLLIAPSVGLDWNDNVYLARDNAEDDFILSPTLALNASYPLTGYNLLNLSVACGYNKYLNHSELSRFDVQSGSALSFDLYVKDLWINVHDRVSYSQDSATSAAIANTGEYGTFQNTSGLSGTWDLEDVTLTLGYDHQIYRTTTTQFDYTDNSGESILARAGLKVHPKLTLGVEGTVSLTSYDQKVLNDNTGYSGGVYGDWRPGSYLSVRPRFGYSLYDFHQTSLFVKASNESSWYVDLTLSHQATDFMSYSLSAGHELTLGIQADSIEDWYFRPNITWTVIKDVGLDTSFFFEQGKQGSGKVAGFSEENFDQYGGSLSLSCSPIKRLQVSLNYRLTLRSSDVASREYAQNMVGIRVSYAPQ